MKIKVILNIFLLSIVLINPGYIRAYFEEADSAYKAGDFPLAISLLKDYEEENGSSPELLYDLGNAYYRNSDYANAILCYERAYRIKPSDKQIKANLTFLRNKVQDANRGEQKGKKQSVEEDEPTFFQSVHNAIAVETYSDRWAVWSVVSFFLLLILAGIYIFTRNVILRKIGFFGGFIVIGTTIICIIFACLGASAFNNREAGVIMSYKTSLLDEPQDSNKGGNEAKNDGNILTRGTKVRVISEETDATGKVIWYKIRLNSNYIGWVKAEDLEII